MASRLVFRILGPLEVEAGGAVVPIGGPKQRALLALLLLSAGRPVSRDRLIDELFHGQPQGGSTSALRVHVSRLRKALGDSDDNPRLVMRPPGYLLRVHPGELDLHEFERLVAEGRAAVEALDLDRASVSFRTAESLWRGRALADLEFEPFARIEAERLEELRLECVEERIDVELGLGRHAALASELEALVAAHPLRERVRGQQMLALYRGGRQADALASFRAGRALLVDELAIEPTQRLKELEQAILRQDESLGLPAARQAPSEPRQVRRRRWPLILVGAAAAAAAATTVAITLRSNPRTAQASVNENGLALVSLRGTVSVTVPLPGEPSAVASGFGSLWVTEANTGELVRVDPGRRAVVESIGVGNAPTAVAAGAGDVWVADALDGTVARVDPATDRVVQTVAVGRQPSSVVVSQGHVWVANHGDGTVSELDPVTGRIQRVVETGSGPSSVLAADGSLWVANDESGTVTRVDPHTGSVVDQIPAGDAPSDLAAGNTQLWVLDRIDSTVSRIDPTRDQVAATYPLSSSPSAIAAVGAGAWVTDDRLGTLTRIDAAGVLQRTQLGGRLQALTPGAGGLWVAAAPEAAGHRGGTLRVDWTFIASETIDPTGSSAQGTPPTQLYGLLNDGLVTLNHAAGAQGTRLVPDLALTVPRPSDGGLTYTFRLRPGIRYSTGAIVRASDVRHSFERLFEMGSAGANYFEALAGAERCLHRRAACDLSRGIVTDDAAGTVTFHLASLDPDFLDKLTLSYAFVLPSSTPARESHTPLPATGPYKVALYRPGDVSGETVLVRNPWFHEWSAAAQPAGYPDRIRMLVVEAPGRAAELVAKGKGDFTLNVGPIPGPARDYFLLRHPGQAHANPTMVTNFLILNVHAPPFDDVRVRRALNLAIDRSRIVAGYGGPTAARATCQLLPPSMPGYGLYCPFTRAAGEGRAWQAPDLAKARRLVAASGTRGMTVKVWDSTIPVFAFNEGRAAIAALRQLGYRARMRLVAGADWNRLTNDSRSHAQVIDEGWTANYPAADNFLNIFICRSFVADNPGANQDPSEYCNHSFDRQVARASRVQLVDQPKADALWARLDREITDAAPLVPTATPEELDLLSGRVGNYEYNPVWGPLIDQLWVR